MAAEIDIEDADNPGDTSGLRLGEATIRLLEQFGVELVFGIPGVHTIEFYRGFAGSRIKVVTTRHEQGAGFMADAYARVTGRPGVCLLISGPGVTNAATPIAQAYHDSVPLLILASTGARAGLAHGTGSLHDLPDQAVLLRSITAGSDTVAQPSDVAEFLDRAWTVFESRRPRPVHLAIPTDMLGASSPPLTRTPRENRRPVADASNIERAANLLATARRPAILLGGGAIEAGSQALRLAEAIQAPIIMTGNGNGTVASGHPLCLGATLPLLAVRQLLLESDVVLLVGTELSDVDTIYSGVPLRFGGHIIRIDIDPQQLAAKVHPAVAILSDAGPALDLLALAMAARPKQAWRESGLERVADAREGFRWTSQTEAHRPWLDAIEAALPEDRVVVLDSTELAYSAHHYLRASPRGWIAPFGYGTLGAALPMAIGAKLGAPDRAVVAIAGDGGILFTVSELATAVDLAITLPIIVWDNAGFGEMRTAFDKAGVNRVGTEVTAMDLKGIARGFGCKAIDAASPKALGRELTRALVHVGPTLIRIPAARGPSTH